MASIRSNVLAGGFRIRLLLLAAFALSSPATLSSPAAMQVDKSTGPLKIVDALFEDVDGFPEAHMELKAGGEAVLTFRVEGFERLTGKGENGLPESWVRLQYEVEMRDPGGVLVQPAKAGDYENLLGPLDDKWRPLIHWTAEVPEWAPTGNYPIRIRIRDSVGDKKAEQSVTLRVIGESVAPSSTLQAENLQFARSDRGPWSSQRYFALKDPVYVRFHVVGFSFAPGNQVSVEQDWSVLDAEGKVVVSKENAVTEQLHSFYPTRFLTTQFRLDFENPKPGPYTLHITLRDRNGDQTASLDAPFNLRP
jgi:hypothetical protein